MKIICITCITLIFLVRFSSADTKKEIINLALKSQVVLLIEYSSIDNVRNAKKIDIIFSQKGLSQDSKRKIIGEYSAVLTRNPSLNPFLHQQLLAFLSSKEEKVSFHSFWIRDGMITGSDLTLDDFKKATRGQTSD